MLRRGCWEVSCRPHHCWRVHGRCWCIMPLDRSCPNAPVVGVDYLNTPLFSPPPFPSPTKSPAFHMICYDANISNDLDASSHRARKGWGNPSSSRFRTKGYMHKHKHTQLPSTFNQSPAADWSMSVQSQNLFTTFNIVLAQLSQRPNLSPPQIPS